MFTVIFFQIRQIFNSQLRSILISQWKSIGAFGIANRRRPFALLPRKSFGNSHLSAIMLSAFDINIFRANRIARSIPDSKIEFAEPMQIFAPKLNS